MAKKMTMMERRQQLIDDRAARLARDAAKQGLTPKQLLQKKKDTYVNVVGGAALGALPIGALAGTAAKIYKGIMAGKKAVPAATTAAKTTAQAATKPAASTTSKGTTRLAKADKAAQVARGKPSAVANVSPAKLAQMTPQQRKAVQNLQRVNAKPPTRNQAGKATAQARVAAKPKMTPQQRKAARNLANINAARASRKPSAGTAAPKRSKITTQPPKKSTKPLTRKQAAGLGIGTTALVTAGLLGNKGQKKSKAALPKAPPSRPSKKTPMNEGNTVAGMKGKPTKKTEGGPGRPATNKGLPPGALKKFGGSYNSKTQKLKNIGGVTYVFPKSKTVKKKAGGTPGKYKGFSKLPEKVQKKMSPTLAAKYKKGGSVGSSKVARQVKGFGAARRPKK